MSPILNVKRLRQSHVSFSPVRAGKRVRAHVEVLDVTPKDDNRFLIKQGISVEIEGEDAPALVAEWLTMVVTG